MVQSTEYPLRSTMAHVAWIPHLARQHQDVSRDRIYRCDAIVLRRMDLGETDRILTLADGPLRKDPRDWQGYPASDLAARPAPRAFSAQASMLSRAESLM